MRPIRPGPTERPPRARRAAFLSSGSMHKLLYRQLRRACSLDESELESALSTSPQPADQSLVSRLLNGLPKLLEHVSSSYKHYDRDLNLRSRSLDLSSDELLGMNERLRVELARRNESEAKLRESQLWFHTIFQESPIPIFVVQVRDGVIHDVNKAALTLYGYRVEEMIGHKIVELDLLVDPQKYQAMLTVLRADGRVVNFECQHHNRAGEVLDVLISGETRIMGDEHVLIVQIINVTDRKRARQQLSLQSFALNQVREAAYLIDPSARFVFVNDQACRTLGYSRDELLGLTVPEVNPNWSMNRFVRSWNKVRRLGSTSFETHHQTKGGRNFPVEINTNFFEFEGTDYCLVLARDISERKHAEQLLRRAHRELERRVQERTAELEQANKELEAFSYSVSHDLRAPLRAITGFTQILVRRHHDNMADEARQYLGKVVAASERMEHLIEDMLHYSRTGQGAIRMIPVSLTRLVRQLGIIFGERIAATGATLEVLEPLPTPLGDPTLIEQVLSNLVENALTYCHQDRAPKIQLSAECEGREVVLRVSDNGIGILPKYHEKIFKVFQRLHGNDEYPGTGIGLAIVAKAVLLMQGRISVESNSGEGSTFIVRLPAAAA